MQRRWKMSWFYWYFFSEELIGTVGGNFIRLSQPLQLKLPWIYTSVRSKPPSLYRKPRFNPGDLDKMKSCFAVQATGQFYSLMWFHSSVTANYYKYVEIVKVQFLWGLLCSPSLTITSCILLFLFVSSSSSSQDPLIKLLYQLVL